MYRPLEIAPNIYWVGAIDWNERNFHGYTTDRGSTYNAYLIVDEKVTLIDTVKAAFTDEMLERISCVVDPSKIDVIVSNHSERDHSGALPRLRALNPQATIYTSKPQGARFLEALYGDLNVTPVANGEEVSIGARTLRFTQVTMVHWPDSMVTYDETDKILFSNDAFGQHLATSERFADQVGQVVFAQARTYYANIVAPYAKQVRKALGVLGALDVDVICPSHGVIWRDAESIGRIVDLYTSWSSEETDDRALVVYDSMWHATEGMANAIVEGFTDAGVPVRLMDLKNNAMSDIVSEALTARYLAVGSPTLNSTMMATVAAFLCYLRGLTPRGMKPGDRIGIPFGSYGWAPAGPSEVADELTRIGYTNALGTFAHAWAGDEAYLDDLRAQVAEGVDKVRAGDFGETAAE